MNNDPELATLESGAYRDSYSDGMVDAFVGLALLWIGIAWIWLPDIAGLAGVFPAIFVSPLLVARKRIVEARAGYVKWSPPRRRWEQRNLVVSLAAGVLLMLIGVAVFIVADRSESDTRVLGAIGPGLLAFLLALLALGLSALMNAARMILYAGVLAIGGFVAVWQDSSPGLPMVVAGGLITVIGLVMLIAFIRSNPKPELQ
jgi:hypothetical protein